MAWSAGLCSPRCTRWRWHWSGANWNTCVLIKNCIQRKTSTWIPCLIIYSYYVKIWLHSMWFLHNMHESWIHLMHAFWYIHAHPFVLSIANSLPSPSILHTLLKYTRSHSKFCVATMGIYTCAAYVYMSLIARMDTYRGSNALTINTRLDGLAIAAALSKYIYIYTLEHSAVWT